MYIPKSWINHFSIKHCAAGTMLMKRFLSIRSTRLDSLWRIARRGDAKSEKLFHSFVLQFGRWTRWAADEAKSFRHWKLRWMRNGWSVRQAFNKFYRNSDLKSSDKLVIYKAPNKLNSLKTEKRITESPTGECAALWCTSIADFQNRRLTFKRERSAVNHPLHDCTGRRASSNCNGRLNWRNFRSSNHIRNGTIAPEQRSFFSR